ncbi:hypothetical protein TGME49_214390 [Toxoplasma gondii ME49]|uniref:Uncharacterized protein n=2 Tax=Toxoplasma gondii TaxID=5811 RepID=A0A086JUU2_TOXGO|nr:hypothetical protein TGME49_214390 [Toxoplasma gondii ME49]EPT26546.1 hypothetical protein TGME49_214390 [Toxoplasma gondii ME49]KFG35910.1 hypothetical protein TGDOM2_214390 [Toxoplasma gondii GAB2-2007-GAL-DOM2]|eukprot:XP_002370771.1 hypothetical protein TGME49_214390 [Toxoplasma gondii ME49]
MFLETPGRSCHSIVSGRPPGCVSRHSGPCSGLLLTHSSQGVRSWGCLPSLTPSTSHLYCQTRFAFVFFRMANQLRWASPLCLVHRCICCIPCMHPSIDFPFTA